MITIEYKPLSVNQAWQGKRFKTPAYKKYESDLLFVLPKLKLPDAPYFITYNFYFSNKASDIDNGVKPLTDILSKKYGFNDKLIYKLVVNKYIVPKGLEKIEFKIETNGN